MPQSSDKQAPSIADNLRGFRILAWAAFASLNILYLVSCLQRTAIPGAIFEDIQSDIGLEASQVTRLGSLYVLVYGLSQIPAGMLVDRFGGKKMSIIGSILMAIGLILFSQVSTPFALNTSRVITALGHSFVYLCIVKITHILFRPKQFGFIIATTLAIGFTGGIIGTLPIQRLSQLTSWRLAFLGVGMICAVTGIVIAIVLSSLHEKSNRCSVVTWQTVKNLFNERGRFCFMTGTFWAYPALFVLQAIIGQKFIQDRLGYSATTASLFTMCISIGCIIVCFLSTPFIKLVGDRRKPAIYISQIIPMASAILMLLGIRFNLPAWVFILSFLCVSVNQISGASTSFLLREITDTHTIAFTAAVRNSFPYIGSAILGAICGQIMDAHALPANADGIIKYTSEGYFIISIVMLALATIGLIVSLGIPETRGKNIYK